MTTISSSSRSLRLKPVAPGAFQLSSTAAELIRRVDDSRWKQSVAEAREKLRAQEAEFDRAGGWEQVRNGGPKPKAERFAELVEYYAEQLRARREAKRIVDDEESSLTVVRFESVSAGEFLVIEFPPDPMIVDRFVIEGGNTLVVAPKKTSKTTTAANLSRSLVEGIPFLGAFDCTKPRRTHFTNLEMSDEMLQLWLADIGIRPEARDLLVVSRNLRGRRLALTDAKVRRAIAQELADHAIDVWLIDCMRPLIAACGFNENDNAEISRLLLYVDEIKQEAGCTAAVGFHHAGKGFVEEGQESGRGASAWGDWPDIQVFITKDRYGKRFLRTEGRVDDISESRLEYDPVNRHLRLAVEGESRADARLKAMEDAAVEAVTAEPGINKRDLRDALGDGENAAKDAGIAAAINHGRIHVRTGSRNAKLHYPGKGVE